jgi:hypothetical protein
MTFHISAKEIELKDGHWLKATLKNRNGDWVHSKIDLDECLGNTDGNPPSRQSPRTIF